MSSNAIVRNWLKDASKSYPTAHRVQSDIIQTINAFPSLRPKSDVYTFDDGRTQLLLCVHGLVPIVFRGAPYNIPIAVWIQREYPTNPPIVYVVPTTDMLVRPGKCVDVSGLCSPDYLQQWQRKQEGCDLLSLIQALRDQFSLEPPVYAKPKPRQGQSLPVDGPPVLPAKPSSIQSTPALVSVPNSSTTSPPPPPLPPHPSLANPIPFIPHKLQSPPVNIQSSPSQNAPPPPPPPPPPIPHHLLSQLPFRSSSAPTQPYSTQTFPHNVYPTPPPIPQHIQAPPPPPAPPIQSHTPIPVPNLLDTDPDSSIPSTIQTTTAPPPPRPPNPELLHLHAQIYHKLTQEFSSLSEALAADADRLRAHQVDLLAGEPAIKDEMARLEAVRDVCQGVANRYRGAVNNAEHNIAEIKRKGDPEVDELVCATTIVHNQLINLVADDNAIEDTIYHLHRALSAGRIDLERFLRSTRALAEEQFMKRALIDKIHSSVSGVSSAAFSPDWA